MVYPFNHPSQILLSCISSSPDAQDKQRECCRHTGASQGGGLGDGEDQGDYCIGVLYVAALRPRLGCTNLVETSH